MADLIQNDFSYLEQYRQYIAQPDFWKETLAQLNKDLGREDAIKVAPELLSGDNVAELVVLALQKYLPEITPQLSERLYRIDIGEKQVESLRDMPVDIYYRCLGEIILKRIIQKVITRKAFSAKKLE
ncbi:MAG: hypothetical protein ACLQQ4_08710 [Bacteroidia bacterium]